MIDTKQATIFDIKEFTIHDGPGIRTTVFFKGCPLRCAWCHNPEGQTTEPQALHSTAGTRIAGKQWTPQALADFLNPQADVLTSSGGGITLSGGEPLMHADFLLDFIPRLSGIHVLLQTSGYANEDDFLHVAAKCNLVYYDLKLIDSAAHKHYTRCDNAPILRNLISLSKSGVPYVIRVPLVPGVTDTAENFQAIASTVHGLPGLVEVQLLPYNRAAGGKYKACDMDFEPEWDESQPCNTDLSAFTDNGVSAKVV